LAHRFQIWKDFPNIIAVAAAAAPEIQSGQISYEMDGIPLHLAKTGLQLAWLMLSLLPTGVQLPLRS